MNDIAEKFLKEAAGQVEIEAELQRVLTGAEQRLIDTILDEDTLPLEAQKGARDVLLSLGCSEEAASWFCTHVPDYFRAASRADTDAGSTAFNAQGEEISYFCHRTPDSFGMYAYSRPYDTRKNLEAKVEEHISKIRIAMPGFWNAGLTFANQVGDFILAYCKYPTATGTTAAELLSGTAGREEEYLKNAIDATQV